ncbi:MAG: DNA mismatch repair endonuclease MutL [Candidatus Limivicinus sp.]
MADINILSPHVADLIAAGEVVERPASVVKELMENSFDAGAKNITVEIRGGGATYIMVRDDGCGMAPEDAGIAFLRHATSKLRDEQGLEAISTMGFRGEALAAISSVSRIELKTRRRGGREGTFVNLEAGEIQDMGSCGCPEGTSMLVRDIFYNTPARLKFLKSDRSEAAACRQAALRCALGRPEVSVRFIKDGKEEFFSPGDGRQDSCVYTLLGRELAASMLRCSSDEEGLRLSGFCSSPSACRGSRNCQYFYCNGRYIKSPLLQTAVEQAYRNSLLSGRFPACVLYVELGCGSVDVNVHPAKTEVKFSYEKKLFDFVYQAVKLMLQGESRTAEIEISEGTRRLMDGARQGGGDSSAPAGAGRTQVSGHSAPLSGRAKPSGDFYRQMSAEEFREKGYRADSGPGKGRKLSGGLLSVTPPRGPKSENLPKAEEPLRLGSYDMPYQTSINLASAPVSTAFDRKKEGFSQSDSQIGSRAVENSVQNVESQRLPDHKIVGEALKTYIIIELKDELILIDKHAAHERMIFDRLKSQDRKIMAQNLLCPVTVQLSEEDGELLEKNASLLQELGYGIEPYGERTYIIRAVPADMDSGDAAASLEEICEKLRQGSRLSPQDMRDEILRTVACKAAIKAGWDTAERELETIAEEVLSGRIKYCPHGRPVSVVVTQKDLEKKFKRIV